MAISTALGAADAVVEPIAAVAVAPVAAPRVSVVVPAYNAADTLDEALASVAGQSIEDWELVVVDDGSTDGTAAVVERWARADPRVRLIRQTNGGVSKARNVGIEAAAAPWLLFLDADDWMHPRALENFLSAMNDAGAGLAYGSLTRVAPDGTADPLWCHPELSSDPARLLRHHNHIPVHVLVSTALVRELGGFDTSLKTCEDWDLWRRMAFRGVRFVRAPAAITYYRMREGSASMDGRQMLRDTLQVLDRNPPLPRGAATEDDAFQRTLYVLWGAALEAGAGRDPVAALQADHARLSDVAGRPREVAAYVYDGARVGARVTVARGAAEWARVYAAALPLLEHVAAVIGRPDLVRGVTNAMEFRSVEQYDFAGPATLSTVHARLIDLREPLPDIVPPPGTDTLTLRVCVGGQTLGQYTVPAYGPLPARELAQILTKLIARGPYLRHSGVLRRPAFWAEAAARAPAALLPNLLSPARAKRALEAAVTDAALRASGRAAPPSQSTSLRRAAAIVAEETARARAGVASPRARTAAPTPSAAGPRVERIPVLMYHQVTHDSPEALARYRLTPEAFEAQLRWLRDNGWRAITTAELVQGLQDRSGFPDKSLVMTFDDAFRDFRETAWPLLKQYGCTAEVYVPTDKVGGASDWDARYGPTAPLMDWAEIEALAAEGVVFGSHLATHTRPDLLGSEALLREAARSRAVLEARLGAEVTTIATPFGVWDQRIAHTLALAGITAIHTCEETGLTRAGDPPMRLKRVEVRGDLGLDAFVAGLTEAA